LHTDQQPLPAKQCVTCFVTKPLTEFHVHKLRSDGRNNECKSCRTARSAARYQRLVATSPETILLGLARTRASKKGIPFDLTEEDVRIPNYCPVLGIPLVRGSGLGGHRAGSPSLDRVRPELGYVKGNVIVISHRANTLKRDATIEEMQALAAFYSRYLDR
jgi:hypothetical protein